MSDFNIDRLKDTWQQQKIEPKYNSKEILQMLNKKSRNDVKYIYWISLVEFLLFLGISIFYIFKGDDTSSFYHLINELGIEKTYDVERQFEHLYFILKLISILVGAYFVIRFYLQMKKVHIEGNLKKFISNILNFRKIVHLFIGVNILLLISYIIVTGITIYLFIEEQHIELSNSLKMGFIIGIVISLFLSLVIIWGYYKLIYGIILRRLNKTLKQLQEIEQEN